MLWFMVRDFVENVKLIVCTVWVKMRVSNFAHSRAKYLSLLTTSYFCFEFRTYFAATCRLLRPPDPKYATCRVKQAGRRRMDRLLCIPVDLHQVRKRRTVHLINWLEHVLFVGKYTQIQIHIYTNIRTYSDDECVTTSCLLLCISVKNFSVYLLIRDDT